MKQNNEKDKKSNSPNENGKLEIDYDYRYVIPENLHDIYLAIGRENYEKILDIGGGGEIYFPCRKSYDLAINKENIYAEYIARASYRSLAKKYNTSVNTIRSIVKKCAENHRKNKK
ncbi:Mor transcription activator family protein [Intestinibacter sp.]